MRPLCVAVVGVKIHAAPAGFAVPVTWIKSNRRRTFRASGDGVPSPSRTAIRSRSFCLNKSRDAGFIAIWNHKKIGLVAVAHVLANSEEILSAPNQVGLFCVTNQDRVTRQGGQSLRELQFHKQPLHLRSAGSTDAHSMPSGRKIRRDFRSALRYRKRSTVHPFAAVCPSRHRRFAQARFSFFRRADFRTHSKSSDPPLS